MDGLLNRPSRHRPHDCSGNVSCWKVNDITAKKMQNDGKIQNNHKQMQNEHTGIQSGNKYKKVITGRHKTINKELKTNS